MLPYLKLGKEEKGLVVEEVCPFLNVAKRVCYALPQQPDSGPVKTGGHVRLTEFDVKKCEKYWQTCPNRRLETQLQELEAQGFFKRRI